MRAMSSASSRISASVGDSEMTAVRTNVRMLMPRMSGSRKDSALAPPSMPTMPVAAAVAYTCMAAMPV
jgi:hypothetical protein